MTNARKKSTKKSNTTNLTPNQVVSIIKKEQKKSAEWKSLIYNLTKLPDNNGTVQDLTQITQSTTAQTDQTRLGDQVMLYSIKYKYQIHSADRYNTVRIIFFQWFPDTTPIVGDVLDASAGYEVYAPYNTDHAPMYKIHMDKIHVVNSDVVGYYDGTNGVTTNFTRASKVFKGKIQPNRKRIQYQGGGTTGSNKIYMITISDSTASSHPTVIGTYRLNFTDA